MYIKCPKCKRAVKEELLNKQGIKILCPGCGWLLKYDQKLGRRIFFREIVNNPPKGTWFRKEKDKTVVGCSITTKLQKMLLDIILFIVLSFLISILEFPNQAISITITDKIMIVATIFLWLQFICGKVEISIRGDSICIFEGIGRLGTITQFNRSEKTRIHDMGNLIKLSDRMNRERLFLGENLTPERRLFLFRVMRHLLEEGTNI